MKIRVVLIGFVVSTIVFSGGCVSRNKTIAPSAENGKANADPFVDVEILIKNPDDYRGPIQVVGVVKAASSEKKTLALIDRKEFMDCAKVTCAKYVLPAQWEGPMPDIKDEVLLKGEIGEVDGKLLFIANELEKRTVGARRETSK